MIYALPLVFGFLNRCRGGFFGTGSTQLARTLFWLLPIAVCMSFINWRLGWLCGLLSYLPLVRPFNHVPFQNTASLKDCLGMAFHAALTILVAVAPLLFNTPFMAFAAIVGILAAPAHYLALKLDGVDSGISTGGFKVPLINLQIQPGKFAVGGSEWSEVSRGCVIGVGFVAAFVIHAAITL